MIDRFDGEYNFLSNFYECDVVYDGIAYRNSEAAFQAQKTLDMGLREQFGFLNPSEAKKLGRKVFLREDWDEVKDRVMLEICLAKFSQNEDLKKKLLATGDAELVEGNWWHDNCWGNCTCEKCNGVPGENRLWKILMQIRDVLK